MRTTADFQRQTSVASGARRHLTSAPGEVHRSDRPYYMITVSA